MGHMRDNPPQWPVAEIRLRADGQEFVFPAFGKDAGIRTEMGGYRFETRLRVEGFEILFTRADGATMDVDWLEARFTVPLLHFSKVILPDGGREYIFRDRALFLRSQVTQVTAPNDGHPFVALTDQTGTRTWAFGLLTFWRESTCRCMDPLLSARKAMRGGHDLLTLAFRMPTEGWRYGPVKEVREAFYCAECPDSWFHALRRFTALSRRRFGVRYPRNPAALDPVWCTWTAWCSDRMNDQTVQANARIARHLGIRTLILDDGWFGPGLDTDDRPLNIGDYEPDRAKFSDLASTIRSLKQEGLSVLLWYAPTCLSPDSRAFSRWKDHRIAREGEPVMAPNGFYNLCPCDPEVRAYVCGEIARMIAGYEPDGFKIDLYNTLPTTPCTGGAHSHDTESVIEGVRRMEAAIWAEVQKWCPRGLVELKQNYGNVLSAAFGTMVRAGDTAYDADTNFHRCIYLQTYAPVVHNDYLAASVHDTPRDLAVMMIKSLTAGVPTFSLDLPRQPAENLAVIKGWLEFYNANRALWRVSREPLDRRLETWRMGRGRVQAVSALFDAAELKLPPAERLYVLNGTGRPFFHVYPGRRGRYRTVLFDPAVRPIGEKRVSLTEGSRLSVPSGGLALLEVEAGKGNAR